MVSPLASQKSLTLRKIESTNRRAVLNLVCGFLGSSRFAFLVDEKGESPPFLIQLSQFMLLIVGTTRSEGGSKVIMMDA